jgi:uncharacterized protein YtpQ (UPF0354 family)
VGTDAVRSLVLPQLFPAHWVAEYPIVFSAFPSRVRVGYVLRGEGNYSYVLSDDFDNLGLSLPELHACALDNLRELPSGRMTIAKPPGGLEAFITATDDNFSAARILLPEVREALAADLGEEFLVTIPHRDWCFCWSIAQPPDRQAKHAAEALEDFIKDDYRLTPDILKATRTGLSLYRAQEPAEIELPESG